MGFLTERVFYVIIAIGFLYLLASEWMNPWIVDKYNAYANHRQQISNMERLILIELASSDPERIEKFIRDNVGVLSTKQATQLVARVSLIRDEQVIRADGR